MSPRVFPSEDAHKAAKDFYGAEMAKNEFVHDMTPIRGGYGGEDKAFLAGFAHGWDERGKTKEQHERSNP